MAVEKYLPLFGLCMLSSCGTNSYDQGMVTQLQVRENQTRTFEDTDLRTVMKAMINVLQDEGYIVKNAVLDLGLLTAERDMDIELNNRTMFTSMFLGKETRTVQHSVVELSANVTEFGSDTKVRVNFQMRTFDNYGCITEVCHFMDDSMYKRFFSKVSKGIFLQSENL